MIQVIFSALAAGLSLWNHKEKTKYLDRYYKIKKEWYEEYNKPTVDDAVLDNLEFELRLLVDSFSSKVGVENIKN